MTTIMTEKKKAKMPRKNKMRYFLRHITQMPLLTALLLSVCALAMWTVDYIRMPELWRSLMVTQILATSCAVLLCMTLYRAKATAHFTLLPAVLYIVAVAVYPYLRLHWHPQLVIGILLFFLYSTRDMTDSHEPNGLVFFVTILLCLATLVLSDALWCIPMIWIVVLLQGLFTLRTVLASVLAVVLVAIYYTLAMYLGWAEGWNFSVLFDREWLTDLMPLCMSCSVAVMMVAFLVIAGFTFRRSSYDLVSTRMLLYHVVMWGLLTAPLILFTTVEPDSWSMLPFTLSAVTSIFLLQKQSEARGITFIAYMAGTVALYLWLVLSL